MNFYYTTAQTDQAIARIVSTNLNDPAWNNIQHILKKLIHLWDHQLLPDPTKKL